MFCVTFICIIIKINHFKFRYSSTSDSHTFQTLIRYGYDTILSKVCNLLSSLLLSVILLIYSVYTLSALILNIFCDFNMILLFSKQSLQSLSLSIRFITHFFVPLTFLSLLPSSIK